MIACAAVILRTLPPFLFVLRISKSVLKKDFRYRLKINLLKKNFYVQVFSVTLPDGFE